MLRRLLQEHARHLSFLRFEEIQIVTHRMEALVRLDERQITEAQTFPHFPNVLALHSQTLG